MFIYEKKCIRQRFLDNTKTQRDVRRRNCFVVGFFFSASLDFNRFWVSQIDLIKEKWRAMQRSAFVCLFVRTRAARRERRGDLLSFKRTTMRRR